MASGGVTMKVFALALLVVLAMPAVLANEVATGRVRLCPWLAISSLSRCFRLASVFAMLAVKRRLACFSHRLTLS